MARALGSTASCGSTSPCTTASPAGHSSPRRAASSASTTRRSRAAALPASVVDTVVDELLTRGHIRRPFIGVGVHPVALGSALMERNTLTHDVALVVVSIAEGEAADAAGILLGDLLIAVDGRPMARPSDLLDALSSVPEGGSLRASVLRGGFPHEVTIEPRDRDREGAAA